MNLTSVSSPITSDTDPYVVREEAHSASLRDEWEVLAYESDGSFFQSPQWVEAWQEAYAPEAKVFMFTARDAADTLVGLLPLAELTRPLHRRLPLPLPYVGVAGAGPGSADHVGPIAADPAVRVRLLEAAVAARPTRSVLLEAVGPDLDVEIPGALTKHTPCPAANLTSVESTADLWSSKMRKNLRRNKRQADEAGLTHRWYPPGEAGPDILDGIGALHIARQQTLGRDGLYDDRRSALVAALARMTFRDDDGQWVAVMVDEDEHVRAGLIGFQYAGGFYEYKTGWDPSLQAVAPGKILKTTSIERAIERGLSLYDFLRGTEQYKYRYGGEDRFDTTLLVPRGPSGWLLQLRERFGVDDETEASDDSDD